MGGRVGIFTPMGGGGRGADWSFGPVFANFLKHYNAIIVPKGGRTVADAPLTFPLSTSLIDAFFKFEDEYL